MILGGFLTAGAEFDLDLLVARGGPSVSESEWDWGFDFETRRRLLYYELAFSGLTLHVDRVRTNQRLVVLLIITHFSVGVPVSYAASGFAL